MCFPVLSGDSQEEKKQRSRYSGPSVVSLRKRMGVITLWTGSFRGAGFFHAAALFLFRETQLLYGIHQVTAADDLVPEIFS